MDKDAGAVSKMIYLGVFKNDVATKTAHELAAENHLVNFNFFQKSTVAQFCTFTAGTIAARTSPGSLTKVEEKEYTFWPLAHSAGVCAVAATNSSYHPRVVQSLLRKVLDEFVTKYPPSAYASFQNDSPKLSYPELKEYIVKYQDWTKVDNLSQIQKDLDETKITIHKTIDSVLARGEKIDDLVAKSDGLSAQSKMFYTQAKKQNSCCAVM
ncbi:hypothetical protein HBI25_015530 [Parastagonospora nodorum]|nr:hypothetical protein HBH53_019160 [Parastagonospora nodorum]KAH3977524.1 hypothetical protein HBH52_113570 [Parastagonospora nodorum]KAH4000037.1 hypothetical protein HBI10_108190 [Parastagonospora nodorum]KAH4022312.1 hypothetical protein HBI13_101000 [Parastagonospora nodorum]KAH4027681.1 hypothetical protein HBI09_141820 [Parastagonospora nodorum]